MLRETRRGTWLRLFSIIISVGLVSTACQASPTSTQAAGIPRVVALESFLADIAQNVAGTRLKVETLIPTGMDPHAYEPIPQDIAHLEKSQVILINGAGYEAWFEKTLQTLGRQHAIITASQGLPSRSPTAGEPLPESNGRIIQDPHFWLDPTLVIHYVENIRQGLTAADPAGADIYQQNADQYIAQLKILDSWIQGQVQRIPPQHRSLVTNHESLGYYADRYGLTIPATLLPGVTSEAAPSAQQIAGVISAIRTSGSPAIFLDMGANPQLADQVAAETGVKVVTDLTTETLTPADGPAPTYLEMMRHLTSQIVEALQ